MSRTDPSIRSLTQTNYFLENIMHRASKVGKYSVLMNVRPIGSQDIVSISFSINGKTVAAQGNVLIGRIMQNMSDESVWPDNAHITRAFSAVPAEHSLLSRSCTLVNFGFYQEALVLAYSVFDAKVQELIKNRMKTELYFSEQECKSYIRNITQNRMDTMLNFLFKIIDRTSLSKEESNLSEELRKINTKRNNIVHNGESVERSEAVKSIIIIAKAMEYMNQYHGGNFDIPSFLLEKNMLWNWH